VFLSGSFPSERVLTSDSDRDYSRESIPPESQKLGIRDKGYVPRVLLYISFGLLDAMWQTTSYWLIGAMSNSPQRLAHFTGFCKSLPHPHCPPSPGVNHFQINRCNLLVLLGFGERTELVSRELIPPVPFSLIVSHFFLTPGVGG